MVFCVLSSFLLFNFIISVSNTTILPSRSLCQFAITALSILFLTLTSGVAKPNARPATVVVTHPSGISDFSAGFQVCVFPFSRVHAANNCKWSRFISVILNLSPFRPREYTDTFRVSSPTLIFNTLLSPRFSPFS